MQTISTPNHQTKSTLVYGNPGGYASTLARRATWQAVVSIICALSTVWAVYILGGFTKPYLPHIALLAIGLIGLLISLIGARSAHTHVTRARIGVTSERRVAATLGNSDSTYLFNGCVVGPGGDADHIIVGPHLVVVETKTGYGQVYSDSSGLVAGHRRIPGNPVHQVNRQAYAVGRLANTYATPIVCVVDMTNPPFTVGPTTVCSLADLPAAIAAAPSPLTDSAADALVKQILTTNTKLTGSPRATQARP